jgi:hypothetical protein
VKSLILNCLGELVGYEYVFIILFILFNRVYSVISMTIFSVGRCVAIIPDYSKAKAAALRIMKLNKRESKIDPHDESGIILV